MAMYKIYFSIIFMISAVLGYSQTKPDPNFHIYILMGQSNMAGRGAITEEYKNEQNTRLLMLNKNNNWVMAKHPLHFDKPNIVGVGPGMAFGLSMIEDAKKKIRIGLVPCAVGGTPIEDWEPNAYNKATNTHPYDDAHIRIKEAMKAGIIKGILWHQGEGNSSPEKSSVYINQLNSLILRIRNEIGDQDLPFVIGELGYYRENYHNINKELKKVPALIPFTALASSEGLNHNGDGTHFDSKSASILGMRLAEKMKSLQHQSKDINRKAKSTIP